MPLNMIDENQLIAEKSPERMYLETLKEEMESIYRNDPSHFDPKRDTLETIRVERTINFIKETPSLAEGTIIDLGAGFAPVSLGACAQAKHITFLDIAKTALERLPSGETITKIEGALPMLRLKDTSFQLVLCLDVIAYLEQKMQRLFMLELSTLVDDQGKILLSTPVEPFSDALERFLSLCQSEFTAEKPLFSYHYLSLKLQAFFSAPSLLLKASKEPFIRKQELKKRKGARASIFSFFSKKGPSLFLVPLKFLLSPIVFILRQKSVCHFLETLTKFFFFKRGITHVIVLLSRKNQILNLPKDKTPEARLGKKEVWE